MFPQTDKSWRDYRSLNQNWSYQRTLAGRAIIIIITEKGIITKNNNEKKGFMYIKK